MPRLLALPLMAVVLGILACGSSATEAVPVSTPAATVEAVSGSSPAATPALSSGSSVVPATTAAPDPTSVPISATVPDSTATSPTAALPLPTSGPVSAPTLAPAKAAIIVDQPGLGIDVGQTLPRFEFKLFDGTKLNTAQLSGQGRPVFLFFFATW